VIGHAHLAGQDHPTAQARGAGDADLGDQQRVLAHLDVVADLHEVVDLAPSSHDGIAEGRAVDRGVGADLHVVLDQHAPHLGDLAMLLAVEGEAEAVGAQHGPGVDHHPAAEAHTVAQAHVRIDHAALAHLHAGADVDQRMQAHTGADHRLALDHGERPHRGSRIDASVGGHHRRAVDARSRRHWRMEQAYQVDQRLLGRGAVQRGGGQVGHVLGGEKGAGPGSPGGVVVAQIGEKGDLIGPGRVQRGHADDHPGRVAFELGLQRFRDLAEREPGPGHCRYGFLAGPPAGAGAAAPLGPCWS
jgi:hypothetical protein